MEGEKFCRGGGGGGGGGGGLVCYDRTSGRRG